MANANSILSIGAPAATQNNNAPVMAPAQMAANSGATNPNTPGSPYMGANAQYANTLAQAKVGTSPTPTVQPTPYNQFGGSNTGGASFPGTTAPSSQTQVTPYQNTGSTLQTINQQAVAANQTMLQQQQQQAQQATEAATQATNLQPGQGPENQAQALSSIAPQSLLPQGQLAPQTQIAQQNQQQVQQPQFQQPQVGGYPIQQTAPPLPPTGNLSTPQTVTQPSQQPAPQVDPNTQVQAYNQSTGQTETVSPDDPRFGSGQLVANAATYATGQSTPQQNIIQALGSNSQQDFSSMLQNAMQAGPNTSGAALLQQSLQQQLGAIDDPSVNTYLNNQISRTQQAYEMGMGYNNAQSTELQEAINGTLTNPQTLTGTQAAQAKEAETVNLQSLSAQSAYNQAQQAATVDDLNNKQSDLEGFLKARLALNAGSDSGPSTAALTVMSQSLHEGQINMTLQNAGYTYGQTQLAIQGSQVMNTYTNNIMTLGAQVNQQRMQTTSDYYDGLNQIDQNALSNEQQKRQLTSQAYGAYAQSMTDLNNNELNRQVQYATLAHQTIQDNVQDAYNISGLTGTIYTPDGNGGFQQQLDANGNPIQTVAAKQNQFTDSNMTAQLGLTSWNDNASIMQSIASTAISQGQYGVAQNAIEQMGGMPPGTLNGLTGDQLTQKLDGMSSGAGQALTQIADGTVKQIPDGISAIFGAQTSTSPAQNGGQCGDYASTLSTAPKVAGTWQQRLAQVQSAGNIQDNPQPGYKLLIPLGLNTDGNDTGHVETVVSYDPKTQNMLLAQSNMDLKGTVSMDIQNIGQLSQKYGKIGWGFLPGQLKPNIQQQLSSYTSQNGSQVQMQPQGQPNYDALAAALGGAGGGLSSTAQSIANYSQSSTDAMAGMPWALQQQTMQQVRQINPNYNENNYANLGTFTGNWQSTQAGTTGFKNQSINNAFNALSTTYDAVKSLKPGQFQPTNELSNIVSKALGQTAVQNVYSASAPVVAELAKAFTGSTPDADTLAQYQSLFNPNQSQQQFLDNIKTLGDSLGKQLNTNVELYNTTTGAYPTGTLTSQAQQAMQDIGLKPSDYDPSLQMNIPTTGTAQSTAPTTFNISGGQNPTAAGSKIQAALQAGYAPQDVISYLQSDPTYGSSIQTAQQAGYTPEEIMNYLNQ